MIKKIIIAVIILAFLSASSYWLLKKSPTYVKTLDKTMENNQNNTQPSIIPSKPENLGIEDLKIGQGPEVKSNDTITVHYSGTLTNGQKFDSSYDRNQPFETQIGVGQVIQGWDQGLLGMKAGGKRRLTIPPELGYGNQDMGSIPPNSTLIFEIELLAIK
jgi:FKBP-type peptidyl-prolyl cis-trans isomerase